jgi:hypothetical protein
MHKVQSIGTGQESDTLLTHGKNAHKSLMRYTLDKVQQIVSLFLVIGTLLLSNLHGHIIDNLSTYFKVQKDLLLNLRVRVTLHFINQSSHFIGIIIG